MNLDFSPLASAIDQLEKALAYAHSPLALSDEGVREQFRNSVIHCLVFTYELSHKMLKRHLEERAASPADIGAASFQDLIRLANEQGLLQSDWARWRTYRQGAHRQQSYL
jgi:hypothetical protein